MILLNRSTLAGSGVATSSSKEEVDVTRSSWGHMRWRYFNGIPPWPPRTNKQQIDWHKLHDTSQHLQSAFLTDWVDPSGANNMESLPGLAAAAPPPLFPSFRRLPSELPSPTARLHVLLPLPRVPSTGPKIRWINNSETLIEIMWIWLSEGENARVSSYIVSLSVLQ